MKAKILAEILLKNPESKVTLSVSNENLQIFVDEIIEVTPQGEKQLTIVANINKNCLIPCVNNVKRTVYGDDWEILQTSPYGIKWRNINTGEERWEP